VNREGIVYEKNLVKSAEKMAKAMKRFDLVNPNGSKFI